MRSAFLAIELYDYCEPHHDHYPLTVSCLDYFKCTCITIFITAGYIQSGPKKAVALFYFCDNFRKCTPILTIFSLLEQEIYGA